MTKQRKQNNRKEDKQQRNSCQQFFKKSLKYLEEINSLISTKSTLLHFLTCPPAEF